MKRQPMIEELREAVAQREFDLVVQLSYEHEFGMTTESWDELQPDYKKFYYKRADELLSLEPLATLLKKLEQTRDTCPECKGLKRRFYLHLVENIIWRG